MFRCERAFPRLFIRNVRVFDLMCHFYAPWAFANRVSNEQAEPKHKRNRNVN